MWGYSCSPLCGNAKVNDAAADNGDGPNARTDGKGQEECDLGQYNVDIAGMAASESWLYPCTIDCKWNRQVTNTWSPPGSAAGAAGTGTQV